MRSSPRWTTSTRWPPPSSRPVTTRRCASGSAPPDAGRRSATPRSGSTAAGRSCSTASCAVWIDRARVGRYARAGRRGVRLLLPRPRRPGLRVFYGHDVVPAPGEAVAGGTAKFQRLAERFPNSPADFSLLYLGSTWLPRDLGPLVWVARRRGAPIVVNQS